MANYSIERLRKLFRYDPSSGDFFYLSDSQGHRAGARAGTLLNNGYIQLWVDGKKDLAHRVAWFMTHGEVPPFIDHIDGDRSNNRISNLRMATPRENQQNRIEHRSGERMVGAHYTKGMRHRPWRSIIRIDGKNRHLGYFETQKDAHEAYMEACEAIA